MIDFVSFEIKCADESFPTRPGKCISKAKETKSTDFMQEMPFKII